MSEIKKISTEKFEADDSDFFQPMVRTTDFIHFYKIDIDRIRENFKVFNKGNNYAELQD